MKEYFETQQPPNRQMLFEELASTLQLKASDALSGVEGIEEVSSYVKRNNSSQTDNKDEYDEDMISLNVVMQFRDKLPLVKDKLMEWFGAIEVNTTGDNPYMISIIQEHIKPDGWSAESDRLITPKVPEMPNVFTIHLMSLHEGWDEWLQNVGLV